ncbi:unnamed protein product [Ilex paraguariensis]|uniref:Uncharacterized protein n=1 Tax=Ilex paraguariensis TaxID=185542 RepID=A0ABC8UMD7_9AQUA
MEEVNVDREMAVLVEKQVDTKLCESESLQAKLGAEKKDWKRGTLDSNESSSHASLRAKEVRMERNEEMEENVKMLENLGCGGLNKQCSEGSSFYIDHQFAPRVGSVLPLDDDFGLVRRKEPLDNEYFSDKGSSKSVDNDVGNTKEQVVEDFVDSDTNPMNMSSVEAST